MPATEQSHRSAAGDRRTPSPDGRAPHLTADTDPRRLQITATRGGVLIILGLFYDICITLVWRSDASKKKRLFKRGSKSYPFKHRSICIGGSRTSYPSFVPHLRSCGRSYVQSHAQLHVSYLFV